MKKAIKTPAFYKALGKEACDAYLRRVERKRSTAHWHLDYDGIRFWFWRIWEDESGRTFDSRIRVAALIRLGQQAGVTVRHNLWYHSFNKPVKAEELK